MNASLPPVKPGDIVAGKYRVDRVLGMGGMGVVVAATHVELLETRALKFLLPNALSNAEAVERFLREARAASRLKTEHIARVHDVGKLDDGAPYMVMEYLEGYDLGVAIKQYGAIALETSIFYVLQAMEALAEAHTVGIIHRDLKPANLFLTVTSDGIPCVKVLDFGISKVTGADDGEMDVTKTHAVLGSPHFMCPEQMHSSRNVDVRADIWSLGVILYQLTTGRLPFRGRSVTEIVAMVLSGPPAPPSALVPHLPAGFDAVVLRCLRINREERYANIAELAIALTPFAPASAVYILDRIARVASAFVRKSGPGMSIAPTSSPGLALSPYAAQPMIPAPPPSRPPMPSTAYGYQAPITALPSVPPASAPTSVRAPMIMSAAPSAVATPLPVPFIADPATSPLPDAPARPGVHGYPSAYPTAMSTPPPVNTARLPMPSIPMGQTFGPQVVMPVGTATGAWGGTQATPPPATNNTTRAIYVLSGVIALSVLVLVALQFMPKASNASSTASAAASASVRAPSPPMTTDKPPIVAATTPAPPASASSAPAGSAAPSATTKKKIIVGDPFGTQRR